VSDIGVLLVNLGTPKEPTPSAVKTYLKEFLWDRRVVDVPRPIWWLILNGIILNTRPKRVAKAYASVWSEDGSPLLAIARKQQAALEKALSAISETPIPVELAMTYGEPSMEQAGLALRNKGVKKILVFPLYPQYSATTTAAAFDRLAKGLQRCPHLPELRFINEYHVTPLYIKALSSSVQEYWKEHGKGDRLLMSFHGIPKRYEDNGDPYPSQCRATAKALADSLSLNDNEWLCSFQSRFGREEWVKPYTDETLIEWGKSGLDRVDVISPAFSADCLETLEELEEENRENFIHAGGKEYRYIPCLNDREDHVQMMVDLVRQNIQGW